MALMTMYEIMIQIVGTPANEMQELILYISACAMSTLMVFFVLYLFKLTAGIINTRPKL